MLRGREWEEAHSIQCRGYAHVSYLRFKREPQIAFLKLITPFTFAWLLQ